MLYLQRFVYKPDENRMPDEYSVVEMMQINQGNHIPRCGYLLHSSQTHFCMWHLVKKKRLSVQLQFCFTPETAKGEMLFFSDNFNSRILRPLKD